ncbi:Structural maintenance of chromosomes protein 4 [Armadillidium nasatum]|uniref:Structural maintenance of chromosomes protein n=1 Tax=Armadillidium nasatum TaxID=96803 RepID=A0A5N5T8W3_9CRUS|nr:Structural maintenance of chromosomes protein 4 [Armadillidium nasatum]
MSVFVRDNCFSIDFNFRCDLRGTMASKSRESNKRKSLGQKRKSEEVVREHVEEPENEMEVDDEEEEGGIRIGDIYLPPPPPPACTFDSTSPRLVITHIENEFFKSYAENQVLGPFHKNFTSIVGPNGSGKSNVIDSMLFVFGYRAQKIRSKKISVLIHNSETYPNVQSCTVVVHFQKIIDKGDSEFEEIPNSKFWVSRTAFKDNSSFYQINGKKCQFKAVAKLLRENGIDLDHNRFLILQGEVEQIALMKPKAQTEHDTGMLEYLEDIIGSSRFKDPIELLSKRVEELNELRGEKLNRVKLVEKEKDDLEEPKNEAVTYLKCENDVAKKQNILYQRYILDCSKAKEEAESKKKEVDDGMADIKKELSEMQVKKSKTEEELKEFQKGLETVGSSKEKYNESFKKLESEDSQVQEELKHKIKKRKQILTQLQNDKEKLSELEKVPAKNEKDIEECEKLREEFETTRHKEEASYHKAMESLNSETQQLQDEKAKYETQLIGLRKAVDEAKSILNIKQSELDIYLSTEKNEKKRYDQIKDSLNNVASLLTTRRKEVENLKKSIPDFERKVRESRSGLTNVTPKLSQLEEELKRNRIKLEETRSSMQSSRSRGRVLDAIMEQKASGNIKGIFGRLGDLGGIDSKYDVAASTAIGSLDNIVVDTVDTGQKCINFLKSNNIGIATFIALDKMERFRANTETTIQTPENVPRLFDLIKVKDNRAKTAFYFAIRDTLVANDIDQASRIAYSSRRPRVVTLNGELFEPSGTMSGGGRSVLRGRMGNTATVVDINPREIEQTESRVEELTVMVTEMRKQKASFEDCLQNSDRDINTMKMNMKKYEMEIEGALKQEKTLSEQLKEQEQVVKTSRPDAKRVAELEKAIASNVKSHEKASKAAGEVEAKVNEIHAEIMSITKGKMKGLKKKLDVAKDKVEKLNAEITRLQKAETESRVLALKEKKSGIEEEAAKILEQLKAATLPEIDPEELLQIDLKTFHYQLTVLQEKLAQTKPNLSVLQEYRKKEEVYLQRVSELEQITDKRNEQRKYHEDLRKQRLNEFMSGFTIISNKLKEMYQMITLGGDAELELVDSLDPFSEGIVFSVRPPKKSWKNITNLSGGEKTLSSLALVFALHYYKPTPLYVMDEIDAALDFKNVSIVGNYIKERTKNAQFIIISLRSQMFELADRLVGIYKTYNCTKSITINPAEYVIKKSEPEPTSQNPMNPSQKKTLHNTTKTVLGESYKNEYNDLSSPTIAFHRKFVLVTSESTCTTFIVKKY